MTVTARRNDDVPLTLMLKNGSSSSLQEALSMRNSWDRQPEFSQVQSKTAPLEPVDLNKSVAKAISNLTVLIEERGAQVSVSVLPSIHGDGEQLVQLFQTLIANGIKFCHSRPPRIEVKAYKEAGRKFIQVSDNGVGIEPAHYQRIFQIFQGTHSREEFLGSGGGLRVCQRIMEHHGGSIELESLAGQGSTFTLRF